MHAVLLSNEHLPLAVDEAVALLRPTTWTQIGKLLLSTRSSRHAHRLAYMKAYYRVLFSCPVVDLDTTMAGFGWEDVLGSSYVLRVSSLDGEKVVSEKRLSAHLLRHAALDFTSPASVVHVYTIDNAAHVCLLEAEQDQDFGSRRSHLLPAPHPSGMHPRLARAMVNLTGVRRGTVVDPFCGSGGLLLEAGLMGLRARGSDIDERQIERARSNLASYPVKVSLAVRDALTLEAPMKHVATDLPYGLNTQMADDLYPRFFALLGRLLRGRAVVGVPMVKGEDNDGGHLIEGAGLSLLSEHTVYLHKSLSKRVLVIGA